MSEPEMVERVFASLSENMRKATDSFNLMARYFRGARKEEVESWPVVVDYGDIVCGREECPCDMEASIIFSPFDPRFPDAQFPRFNLTDLYDAVEAHIVGNRDEEAEDD